MQQVTENVFVATGYRGCNPGFVVTSGGLVLVDSPHRPTDGIEYKKAVDGYGSVKYLINTEPHGDHFSSNFLFEATYVAHHDTRATMTDKAFLDRMKEMLVIVDPDYAPNLDVWRNNLAINPSRKSENNPIKYISPNPILSPFIAKNK